ncbi:hypothetical protein [Pseudofulvibacter geojedonensis]|uniref:Substrate import-associated zinc metallohydrolase lipoprotein n=1 Tax=Pseudofulvibacter geojedonensis TaxID=1123758 RepID=A0ABW3HYH8_9FLAO
MRPLFLSICLLVGGLLSCQTQVDNETIGSWEIHNGILLANTHVSTSLAQENWKVFKEMFPEELTHKYLKKLVLISDGIDEKTGALGSLNDENSQWELVLDTMDVNFKSKGKERLYQSVYTYVHEFGHLLTLNNTQVKPTNKEYQEDGGLYLTSEGEALKSSYINLFVNQFWNGKLLSKWDKIQYKYFDNEVELVDRLYNFYLDNQDQFLTDYAAESPEEDIAESWTAFVMKDKIDNPKTIAEQKQNFFYQFPELVSYRKHVRIKTEKYLRVQ